MQIVKHTKRPRINSYKVAVSKKNNDFNYYELEGNMQANKVEFHSTNSLDVDSDSLSHI